MENSMQEQTQNDKMVPIDTSGEAVEVELNEEGQKEEKVVEPEIQVEESPKQEGKEEELEEYSQSVKRRIDKLKQPTLKLLLKEMLKSKWMLNKELLN